MGTIPSYPNRTNLLETDLFPIDSGVQTYKATYGKIKDDILPPFQKTLAYKSAMAFNSLFLKRWARTGADTFVANYRDICWGANHFVGVGLGTHSHRLIRSTNGTTWTNVTGLPAIELTAITYGYNTVPTIGSFVALGGISSGGGVLVGSADTSSWAAATGVPAGGWWTSVAHSRELQMFAAVRGGGGTNRVITSPSGSVWTEITSPFPRSWLSICAGPGKFLAISPTHSMIGEGGTTWTEHALGSESGQWNSVAYSPTLGIYLAVGGSSSGTFEYLTSPDGINWTRRNGAVPLGTKVIWNDQLGVFVCTGQASQNFAISADGLTWEYGLPPFTDLSNASDVMSIAWSPTLMKYVALTTSLGNRILYSNI